MSSVGDRIALRFLVVLAVLGAPFGAARADQPAAPAPSSLLWPPPPVSSSSSSSSSGHLYGAPSLAPPRGSPFAVQVVADLPIIAAAGGIALVTEIVKSELGGPACGLACDPQSINALDRTVLGNRSASARTASDVLCGASIALPVALDFLDVLINKPGDRFWGFGTDTLVLAEVLAVNLALNSLVKLAVRRTRPLVYDPAVDLEDRTDPDASLSFYSVHSSTAFAMATAYSYLFMLRHPGSKLIAPVWVLSESLAAVTAYLRVHAGKHFYTDVLIGAVVGSALGLLIPYLHRRIASPHALQKLAGQHLSITPTLSSTGGGLLVSLY